MEQQWPPQQMHDCFSATWSAECF